MDADQFDQLIEEILRAIRPVFDRAASQGLHNEAMPAIAMALATKAGKLLQVVPQAGGDRAYAAEDAARRLFEAADVPVFSLDDLPPTH
jgi:hypothetical protein